MPKLLPPEVEPLIIAFCKDHLSGYLIQKKLKDNGYNISLKSIYNVINCVGEKRKILTSGGKVMKRNYRRKVRTSEMVKRVAKEISKANPPTQKSIANKLNTSQFNIFKIIHEDLDRVTYHKTKVHLLNESHKRNRKKNCRKLYRRHLAGDKWEFMVTLDEAWMYLDYCNGFRKICYVERGKKPIEEWLKYVKESWPVGFMIVGAICGRGVLPLIKIPKNAKINGEVYRDFVLNPIIEKILPNFYPGEMNKVVLHHDKATSHTCKLTQEYLQKMKIKFGINFLQNKDIPTKAPDAALLDFFGFNYLKQMITNGKCKTVLGLWKKCNQVWSRIPQDMIERAFKSWKKRCRMIVEAHGNHIEHTKNIHLKVLKL